MTDSENKTLAGEYVLGLLEGAAKLEAERRLVSDATFAREVEGWRTRFAAFENRRAHCAVEVNLSESHDQYFR